MTDQHDASRDTTPPSPEWAAQKWVELCDVLGASDPEEVVPRVRTLKERMDDLDKSGPRASEGLVTISEVEEVFQEMHEKLQALRKRNAELVEQLNDDGQSGVQSAFKELHGKTEQLLEALDVTSLDDAHERVKSLNRQLDSLYREKEILIEAGLTGAREALDELDRVREERDDLESEVEQLRDDRASGQGGDAPDALRKELQSVRSELNDVTAERDRLRDERDAAVAERDDLEDRVETLTSTRDDLQNERDALQMERNRLQSERDRLEDAKEDLQATNDELKEANNDLQASNDELKASKDDLREERNAIRRERNELRDERDDLQDERNELREERNRLKQTVDAQEDLQAAAAKMERQNEELAEAQETLSARVEELEDENDELRNENDQLHAHTEQLESKVRSLSEEAKKLENARAELQDENDELQSRMSDFQTQAMDADDMPSLEAARAVRDVLGIESRAQADELADAVRAMHERMQSLSDERQRIADEAGVDDPSDVLTMIRSMEEQLREFYAEREQSPPRDDAASARIPEDVAEVLGVSSSDEARQLADIVRRMSQRLQSLDAEQSRLSEETGLQSADDALAMIQSMEEQLEDLYAEREQTQQQPSGSGIAVLSGGTEIEGDVIPAEVGEVLGVSTVEEAEELGELVKSMTQQLEKLSDEQEKLESAGLTVENALTMIETMEEQLVDLYESRERPDGDDESDVQSPRDLLPSDSGIDFAIPTQESGDGERETSDEPRPERGMTEAASMRISELLGVRTEAEAEELNGVVRAMAERLKELAQQQEKLMDLGMSVENTAAMIESLEEQLVDLYKDREEEAKTVNDEAVTREIQDLKRILGINTPDEARELEEMVRGMGDELQRVVDEKNDLLRRTGVATVDSVAAMIESMEQQLVDLYEQRDDVGDAYETLQAIEDVLGISTEAEAEQLADIARSMEQQLDDLYEDKEKLESVGLNSIEDAVNMIESMEQQLDELYEDKESVQDLGSMGLDPEQDTFQQLQALYAEQEKLKRELGVADADEIIEMVEGLATQLDELYQDRDFETGAAGDSAVLETVPEGLKGDETQQTQQTQPPAASGDGSPVSGDADMMLASMQQQLEALYEEKEALLEQGIGDAREALSRIDELRDRVTTLERKNQEYERDLKRLQSEFGTDRVTRVIQVARNLKSNVQRPKKSATVEQDAKTPSAETTGFVINAAPPLVTDDVLSRLESMNSQELDDLDVGAVRLTNQGKVEYVNEAGMQLPGLEEVSDRTTMTGKNFFFEMAPSTNNNLFFGRFKQGVRAGAMDARFPYTFISPGQGPRVLVVHLHRKPDADVNWILFRPM